MLNYKTFYNGKVPVFFLLLQGFEGSVNQIVEVSRIVDAIATIFFDQVIDEERSSLWGIQL